MKRYQHLSRTLAALKTCEERGNGFYETVHAQTIDDIMNSAPSGSGIDSGTTLDRTASSPRQLVFRTAYHHMNENGMYDGWTEHTVRAVADLGLGFDLKISGRDRNGIKEYLAETFELWLMEEV